MAPRARELALLFAADDIRRVPEGYGRTLAGHLVGTELERGDRVALPGWPTATVEAIEPAGGEIVPGTELTLHVPPRPSEGALNLVLLVDASLTMGKGDPSPFQEAAATIDALLLNGRSFTQTAGVVVQGGSTRQVDPLQPPEDASGASILKVEPRGTFDLDGGLERALELLEDVPAGPRAIVLLTDDEAIDDALETARPALHAGVPVFAVTPEPDETLIEMCELTGGLASSTPEDVFEGLTELVGTSADWSPPEEPAPTPEEPEDYEFEVVIETVEGAP